jgi:hypothetical protein
MRIQHFVYLQLALLPALAMGCALPAEETGRAEGTGAIGQNFYVVDNDVFDHSNISVCWDDTYNAGPEERQWVKDAVTAAYASPIDINLTGWDICDSEGADIVVYLDDPAEDWPITYHHTIYLISFSDVEGDYTGPTGRYWASAQQASVEVSAIHEFGHALGAKHEQYRADTPDWCPDKDVHGEYRKYGYWDPLSISNYCNPAWNGDGYLSTLDVSALQSLYGTSSNDVAWYSYGDAKAYAPAWFDTHQMGFETLHNKSVSGTYIPVSGDFDGDGYDDIFWYGYGSAGDYSYWGRADKTFDGQTESISGNYQIQAGDFDSDGYDDLLLYASGGNSRIRWGDANRGSYSTALSVSITGALPLVGDFDGDGNADVFWYRAGSTLNDPAWYGRDDRSFDKTTRNVNGTYQPVVGDFDGDDRDDVLWYGPGSAADSIWYGKSDRSFGSSSTVSIIGTYTWLAVGDYDDNGHSDILFNKQGDHPESDVLWLFRGDRDEYVVTDVSYLGSGQPIDGDFDGNGKDDIFWYTAG